MLLLSLMFSSTKAQNCGDCASAWLQGTTLGLFPPSTWGLSNCEIRLDYSYRLCINAGPPVTTLYEFKINTIELDNSTTCNYNMDSIVKFAHKSLLERAFAIFQINTNSPGFAINVINPSCLHIISNDITGCDSVCCKSNYQISKSAVGGNNRNKFTINSSSSSSTVSTCTIEGCNFACDVTVENNTIIGEFSTESSENCPDNCYWTLFGNDYVNSNNWLGTKNYMSLKIKTDDEERMRITEDGKVGIRTSNPFGWLDVNVGDWNCNMGKISFDARDVEPQIRFYRPTGTDVNCNTLESFSWHLEMDYKDLKFKSSPTSAQIGLENPSTYVTMRGQTGNVGINIETPTAKLQVQNGSVMFDGTTGSTPTSGAGTRLMWIPEKAAFRGGKVTNNPWNYGIYETGNNSTNDGTQWINGNIGNNTFAFGEDAFAFNTNDIAIGFKANAKSDNTNEFNQNAIAIGYKATSNGANSVAIGGENTHSEGLYSMAIGGYGARAEGAYSVAIGGPNISTGEASYAIGYNANALSNDAFAIGFNTTANGVNSYAFGKNANTDGFANSFVLNGNGDVEPNTSLFSRAGAANQMTMSFRGNQDLWDNEENPNYIDEIANAAYRLFTTVYAPGGVPDKGVYLFPKATSWNFASDSSLKENINLVNSNELFDNIKNVPSYSYSYKSDSSKIYHIGPMAQTFNQYFKFGPKTKTTISTGELMNIAYAGVRGLLFKADTIESGLRELNKLFLEEGLKNIEYKKTIDSSSIIIQNLEHKIKVLEENLEYLKKCCETQNIDLYEDVILEQNTPNPFDQTTSISYYIPERLYPPFEIITTSLDGSIVYDRIPAENKIPKTITISAANYQTGVYIYTIMNAGRVIKSKKMMIIK